jgi:serine/threonine protein kinase
MMSTVKLLDWGEDGFATEAETAKLRASFKQEVAVWHELNHPNVTKVNISALCVLQYVTHSRTFCGMFIENCQFSVLSLLFSSRFLLVVHLHSYSLLSCMQFIGASMGTTDLKIPANSSSSGVRTELPPRACCVVVEYLAGGTLKQYLIKNRRRKLAYKVVVQIALDLARG